jgi:hypothetical protein
VEWEIGQTTEFCDVGRERRDAPVDHIRAAAGAITARFVTPRDPGPDTTIASETGAPA